MDQVTVKCTHETAFFSYFVVLSFYHASDINVSNHIASGFGIYCGHTEASMSDHDHGVHNTWDKEVAGTSLLPLLSSATLYELLSQIWKSSQQGLIHVPLECFIYYLYPP